MRIAQFRLYRIALALTAAAILFATCTSSSAMPDGGTAVLPTADVPPVSDVDAAIERWDNANASDYYVEVEERRQSKTIKIRVVVAGDQVRAAQRLEQDAQGSWSEPIALPLEEARQYTIDQILAGLRQDVLGAGPAPVNLRVAFDDSLGYPVVVHAEALPTYDDSGNLVLNRDLGYDLSLKVKTLLENTFGRGRQPILSLIRSGGSEAWCDSLHVYEDGSSVYADDCRDDVLQLNLPDNRLEELQQLRARFGSLDELQDLDEGTQRLMILGTGIGSPDEETVQQAWDFAQVAHTLLSDTIGLGLTLLYEDGSSLSGFDVFNEVGQPADLQVAGALHGIAAGQQGRYLAYGDDDGVHTIDLRQGENRTLLSAPETGYYQVRSWANSGEILLSHIPEEDSVPPSLGWVSQAEDTWHDLPLPEGVSGYGCDTGASWSPEGVRLAIAGLGYGAPCNTNPGLTVVDLDRGAAEKVVAPVIDSGTGDSSLTAGGHTPAWSSDGEWIAFGLDQDVTSAVDPFTFPVRLYRVHPDGSNLTPLTSNGQGTAGYPAWSPEGDLYYAMNGVSAELDGIYRYDPADNSHTLVIPGSDLRPLSISPDGAFLAYQQFDGLYVWGFLQQESAQVALPEQGGLLTFSGWLQAEE